MKKKILYLILGVALLSVGCSDVDDLPPKTDDVTSKYVLPKPKLLSAEEQAAVQARWAEYNSAIQ